MAYTVAPLARLVEQLERLPGIGHKSAQRLAYYLLNIGDAAARDFVGHYRGAGQDSRMQRLS